jgi:membrane-associated protease RseP (regulator of RpoE activity)
MEEPQQTVFYFEPRRSLRPTWRAWLRHGLLMFVTFCTVTIAGSIYPFGPVLVFPNANPQTWSETLTFFLHLPEEYAKLIYQTVVLLFTNDAVRSHGLEFSLSIMFILTCHEMGHYIACRLYKVDATLPFFIPTPPLIGPAGTFGAFIKIMSPLPSRKATFDIGVAGPIAGFIALIPILIMGLRRATPIAPEQMEALKSELYFSDSLLTHLFAVVFAIDLTRIFMNSFLSAAWLGILVTALNLIPAGQLDGGHAIYAVFGERGHHWIGRAAFAAMVVLSALGLYFYNSPSGILFVVLLGVMLRFPHPQPIDDRPLDARRRLVAVLTLLMFVLCFTPFPLQLRL